MEKSVFPKSLKGISATVLILVLCGGGFSPLCGGIAGSSHDFSARGWGTNEICIFCHTPHSAKADKLAPLWNHASSTATYTLYTSPTMNRVAEQPRSQSKVCLSCHDGTVAVDSFGTHGGTTTIQEAARIGTDLGNDHPVSIRIATHDDMTPMPNCGNCHNPHSITTGLVNSVLPFYDGYVECSTCHEPHNKYPAYTKLLRKSLAGSAICLHCHGK